MKLVFTKLETPATEIKVAFDGVNYKSYNVDEIKSTGYISFTEKECPDLTKVKIQGKFSTLGSVEVNKAVELERGEGGESGISCTFEKDIFEEREVTTTYYCFLFDGNGDGQITEDDKSDFSWAPKFWVEGGLSENAKLYRCYEDAPNSINDLELCSGPNEKLWFPNSGYNDYNVLAGSYDPDYPSDDGGERWLRYPEGDFSETRFEKVKVGTETVTEIITEIQDEPTITENGQTIADEGKAFKSFRTDIPIFDTMAINDDRTTYALVFFNESWIQNVLGEDSVNATQLVLVALESKESEDVIQGGFVPEDNYNCARYFEPLSGFYKATRTFSQTHFVQVIFTGAKQEILYNKTFKCK